MFLLFFLQIEMAATAITIILFKWINECDDGHYDYPFDGVTRQKERQNMQVNQNVVCAKIKKNNHFFYLRKSPSNPIKRGRELIVLRGWIQIKVEALPSFRGRERARIVNHEGVQEQ